MVVNQVPVLKLQHPPVVVLVVVLVAVLVVPINHASPDQVQDPVLKQHRDHNRPLVDNSYNRLVWKLRKKKLLAKALMK